MRIAFVKMKHTAFGGAESYLQQLADGCAARGHDVTLITTAWPEALAAGWTLRLVSCDRRTRAARLVSFSRAAAEETRVGNYDVVFSLDRTERQHVWRAGEGIHPVWLRRRREFEPSWKVWLNSRMPGHRAALALERRCAITTPFLIANSHMIKRQLLDCYGVAEKRVTVIHNGVDLARFSPDGTEWDRQKRRGEIGIEAGQSMLLFVGSGFRLKGLPEALRLLRDVPAAVLVVLGRDDPRRWAWQAQWLGVRNRVKFLGPVPADPSLYRAADVTMLPTWSDSFGLAGLESLACGTPLITTAYAGVAELVVPDVSGAVLETPADRAGLRQAVYVELGKGRALARAQAIAQTVREFSVENNLDRTLAVIEKAARR